MPDLELAHLGYVVADMEAGLRRWVDGGASVVIEPTDDPIQRVTCALLDSDGTPIELVAPLDDDSPVRSRLKRGGGLDHICYFTDSLTDELEREVANGSIVVVEPVHAVTFGRDIAFVHRRTGLVVEYMTTYATEPS